MGAWVPGCLALSFPPCHHQALQVPKRGTCGLGPRYAYSFFSLPRCLPRLPRYITQLMNNLGTLEHGMKKTPEKVPRYPDRISSSFDLEPYHDQYQHLPVYLAPLTFLCLNSISSCWPGRHVIFSPRQLTPLGVVEMQPTLSFLPPFISLTTVLACTGLPARTPRVYSPGS